MRKNQIIAAIGNRERYETKIQIHRAVAGKQNASRIGLLDKRLALIDQWLRCVSRQEAYVLNRHLVDGLTWGEISEALQRGEGPRMGCDERTLQRIQARAIKKLCAFTESGFGGSLDYLFGGESD